MLCAGAVETLIVENDPDTVAAFISHHSVFMSLSISISA
jgi:hypothetical protein